MMVRGRFLFVATCDELFDGRCSAEICRNLRRIYSGADASLVLLDYRSEDILSLVAVLQLLFGLRECWFVSRCALLELSCENFAWSCHLDRSFRRSIGCGGCGLLVLGTSREIIDYFKNLSCAFWCCFWFVRLLGCVSGVIAKLS